MQNITIGGARRASIGYELEDIALVPSRRTRSPGLVDVSWSLDAYDFSLPVVAAPLDAVISPSTAGQLAGFGGLGILNLEGLWTRYADPLEVLGELAELEPGPDATAFLQRVYRAPIDEDLIAQRVEELRSAGIAAGSLSPQRVERYHHAALEAGLDLLVIHGVTVTAQHVGIEDAQPLDLRSFTARYDIPVIVGGVASEKSAMHLMRTGAVGVIVGVGTSSVSTTPATLGVRVPLATAIADVAAARARYLAESGRYVDILASGGIETGAHVVAALACGADAVMLGRALAAADEAPGRGAYWGLGAWHPELPRGRFDRVGSVGPMSAILEGPADRADGRVNLVGALRRAMGVTGYESVRRLREAELVVSAR